MQLKAKAGGRAISWQPGHRVFIEHGIDLDLAPRECHVQPVAQLTIAPLHADGYGELERHRVQLFWSAGGRDGQVFRTCEEPGRRSPHDAGVELASSNRVDD